MRMDWGFYSDSFTTTFHYGGSTKVHKRSHRIKRTKSISPYCQTLGGNGTCKYCCNDVMPFSHSFNTLYLRVSLPFLAPSGPTKLLLRDQAITFNRQLLWSFWSNVPTSCECKYKIWQIKNSPYQHQPVKWFKSTSSIFRIVCFPIFCCNVDIKRRSQL